MPIYEYKCAECGQRIERLQRIDDPPPEACEACGGPMAREVSAPAFQFKGTGWYVTDYGDRKGAVEKDGASQAASSKSDTTKPDSGAEKTKATPATGSAKAAEASS